MLLPIIRISGKKYLEELQNGKLFMRNILYYQRLESNDLARSDPFDGAIPAPGVIPRNLQQTSEISDINFQMARFTTFNTYVSCFFGVKRDQITSSGRIVLSSDIADGLKKFGYDDALIIDLNQFVQRLEKIADSGQMNLNFNYVSYLSEQQYSSELANLMHNMFISQRIEFLKRNSFINQQEFRISCSHSDTVYQELCSSNPSGSVVSISPEIAKWIENSSITVDIGPIQEFSQLIKLSDLLEGHVAIRKQSC